MSGMGDSIFFEGQPWKPWGEVSLGVAENSAEACWACKQPLSGGQCTNRGGCSGPVSAPAEKGIPDPDAAC